VPLPSEREQLSASAHVCASSDDQGCEVSGRERILLVNEHGLMLINWRLTEDKPELALSSPFLPLHQSGYDEVVIAFGVREVDGALAVIVLNFKSGSEPRVDRELQANPSKASCIRSPQVLVHGRVRETQDAVALLNCSSVLDVDLLQHVHQHGLR